MTHAAASVGAPWHAAQGTAAIACGRVTGPGELGPVDRAIVIAAATVAAAIAAAVTPRSRVTSLVRAARGVRRRRGVTSAPR